MVAIGNVDIRALDKVANNPFLGLGANLDKSLSFGCILFVATLDLCRVANCLYSRCHLAAGFEVNRRRQFLGEPEVVLQILPKAFQTRFVFVAQLGRFV